MANKLLLMAAATMSGATVTPAIVQTDPLGSTQQDIDLGYHPAFIKIKMTLLMMPLTWVLRLLLLDVDATTSLKCSLALAQAFLKSPSSEGLNERKS